MSSISMLAIHKLPVLVTTMAAAQGRDLLIREALSKKSRPGPWEPGHGNR